MPSDRRKVLLAMSGGVDSSVAAALLLRDGYDVVGCFMRLGSPGESFDELREAEGVACATSPPRIGHQGCCSINDAADARLVAAHLGIPFYVCNFKKDFGRIIDYFVDEYVEGRTPNPCVRCNDWLKFGKLHEYAKQIDASFVASGHYARIERTPGAGHRLLRGVDHAKDQSYVLFGAPRDRLGEMLLPIGGHQKSEIRRMAREMGLPVSEKPDSQEICFVPDNDYASLVESRRPAAARGGSIVDTTGRAIGSHTGQHRFTLGQRRGLSVSLGHPVYVVGKDPASNTVMVGERAALDCRECVVHEANWLIDPPPSDEPRRVRVMVRSHADAVPAEVMIGPDSNAAGPSGRRGTFRVTFDSPQQAVTPGQALVLYGDDEPDVVLGGGWIASAPCGVDSTP